MQRRAFVTHSTALAATFALAPSGKALAAGSVSSVVIWNRALTSSIAATRTQATIAARACSMVHEAIYNAWASFDLVAAFTLPGMRRQIWIFDTITKSIAIGHAAHDVLVDLFPSRQAVLDELLRTTTASTAFFGGGNAVLVGQAAARALLQARHGDGSNQLGDLAAGAYADTSGYTPVNTPDLLIDPDRWQPLRIIDGSGANPVQKYLTPHWGGVRSFSMASNSKFRPIMAHRAPSLAEMNELIGLSAALDDNTKALVDLWAANPGTVSPPGQWMGLAEQVSANDNNTLDQDVKLFFGVGQAVHDAGIAAWECKRFYDSVRPISAIRYYFAYQVIRAWGGAAQGTQSILGLTWRPYQRTTNPTPPFPEFVSGHSTFSAAAAAVLAGIRGSDRITITGKVAAGQIGFDNPVTPAQDVNFSWGSLLLAADSAGLSRRYGGIHFEQGDLGGRNLGRAVGAQVLARCQALFAGQNPPLL